MGILSQFSETAKSNPFGVPLIRKGECARYQCKRVVVFFFFHVMDLLCVCVGLTVAGSLTVKANFSEILKASPNVSSSVAFYSPVLQILTKKMRAFLCLQMLLVYLWLYNWINFFRNLNTTLTVFDYFPRHTSHISPVCIWYFYGVLNLDSNGESEGVK